MMLPGNTHVTVQIMLTYMCVTQIYYLDHLDSEHAPVNKSGTPASNTLTGIQSRCWPGTIGRSHGKPASHLAIAMYGYCLFPTIFQYFFMLMVVSMSFCLFSFAVPRRRAMTVLCRPHVSSRTPLGDTCTQPFFQPGVCDFSLAYFSVVVWQVAGAAIPVQG